MPELTGPDIVDLTIERERVYASDHFRWTKIAKIVGGKHREVFPREFRAGEVEKIAGFIRRSWRMFARNVGKVPDVQVSPLSLRPEDQDRAARQENICFAYNDVWSARRKYRRLAEFLVGMGACGVAVIPDVRRGYPMLLVEDPRHVLPGAGAEATDTYQGSAPVADPLSNRSDVGGTLQDAIIRKRVTGRSLRRFLPGNPTVADLVPDTAQGFNTGYELLQFLDDEWWTTVLRATGTIVARARHGVGWCPAQFPNISDLEGTVGASDLEQQIGIEVAFMRLIDQKLSLNDAVVWPWLVKKGFTQVDADRRIIDLGSPDADVTFLAPPANFEVRSDLLILRDLLRVMNFETEASQGEVTGGPITGRGLVELNSVVVGTTQAYYDDLAFYMPRLYTTALVMDRNLFGGTSKQTSGQGRGEPFFLDYDPAADIGEAFGRVTVEFGPGLGGFEGHLQMLQDLGAEAIPLRTIMEKNPHIPSYTAARRQILIEKAQRLLFESALTGKTAVSPVWLANFILAMQEGADPERWLVDNPPEQATATPENVPPVPPEIAAQLAAGSEAGGPEEGPLVNAPPLAELFAQAQGA